MACDPEESCGGGSPYCPANVNMCSRSAWFQSGIADGFSTANGTESPQPSSGLQTFVRNNYAFAEIRNYDDRRRDRFFAHTFTGITQNGLSICGARLTVRVLSDGSNDSIVLGFVDANGGIDANRWSASLSSLGVVVGQEKTLTLDLETLPRSDGTTVELLPMMQSKGWLDLYVQDDTAVDYLTLQVDYCS